jgi:hypothetical protein
MPSFSTSFFEASKSALARCRWLRLVLTICPPRLVCEIRLAWKVRDMNSESLAERHVWVRVKSCGFGPTGLL